MLGVYVIDGFVLPIVEAAANRLLRLFGGPDRVPQRNEDLVWY